MSLQEYRARQAEAYFRRNYQMIRAEHWARKQAMATEDRRKPGRPWA